MVIEFERTRNDEPMSTKRNSYTPEQKLKVVLESFAGAINNPTEQVWAIDMTYNGPPYEVYLAG